MRSLPLLTFTILVLIILTNSCEPSPSEKLEEIQEPEEIIEVMDPNFRYALLQTNCVDTNNDKVGDKNIDFNKDGNIDLEEIEAVESLILAFNHEIILGPVNLEEIKYFSNLKYLAITRSDDNGYIENTGTTKMASNFTALHNLKTLKLNYLGSDFYSDLDLSNLENLTKLDLMNNNPSYLIEPQDWEYPTHFIKIHMNGCINLEEINMENSFLIVDFCEAPSIKKLNMRYLEGGEPDVFDFHCLEELEELDISENRITKLILKNRSVLNTFSAYDIGNSGMSNYPFVKEVCIDDLPEELEQISEIINEHTVINTDCTF